MNQKKARQLRKLSRKERKTPKELKLEYMTSGGKSRIIAKLNELGIK